jgi:hypothetical protein
MLSGGMRNDEKAFPVNLLPLAEEIIFSFLQKYISY